MRRCTIGKTFTFEASHTLPGHQNPDGSEGPCARLHGHSYVLNIEVTGYVVDVAGSSDGFVMDYHELKRIVQERIISVFDHRHLNDLVPFRTTAENLAWHFFGLLYQAMPGYISAVTVRETASSWATCHRLSWNAEDWNALLEGAGQ